MVHSSKLADFAIYSPAPGSPKKYVISHTIFSLGSEKLGVFERKMSRFLLFFSASSTCFFPLFSSGRTVTNRNWLHRLVHMRGLPYATNSCGHDESIVFTIIVTLENNITDLKIDLNNRAKVPQLRFFS